MPSLYDTNPGIISSNDNITTTLYNTGNAANVPVAVVHPATLANHTSGANFTTLYNASNLSAPDAGAGSVTGNLNVSGNLTVQGTSNLIGAVVLGSTLSLPNYTFPLNDGVTDQVLTTDGNGNVYWADVASLALPSGVKGDVLYYDGTNWTASNRVSADASTQRFVTEYNNSAAGITATMFARKNFGATNYVSDDGPALAFQVDSNSQTVSTYASMGAGYDATDPSFGLSVSTDNYATKTFIAKFTKGATRFNGTNLNLNYNHTGAPTDDAYFRINRGSSTNALLTWDETIDKWNFNFPLTVDGTFASTGFIGTSAESIAINTDSSANDSFLYFKGATVYITYNNTLDRLETSTDAYIGGDLSVGGTIAASGVISTTADAMVINSDSSTTDSYLYLRGATNYPKYDYTNDNMYLSDPLYVNGYTTVNGNLTAYGVITTTAESITMNSDSTAADSFLYLKGTSVYVKYNNTTGKIELSDSLVVDGDITVDGSRIHFTSPIAGQAIVYNGTDFVNTNKFEFTDAVNGRATFINNATPGTSALAALKRESSLVDGQVVGSLMGQIVGTTQTYTHRTVSEYDSAGNNIYRVEIDPVGNFNTASTTITSQLVLDNNTASVAAASVVANANVTGAPTLNASFVANRGSSADTSIVWNETTDRWTSTVDGTTFLNLPNQNLDITSDVTFSSVTIDGISGFNTQQTTTTSLTTTNISATTRRTQKVVIDIVDNVTGEVHVLEALAFQKSGVGYITTYAEMYSGIALATFSANVASGFIRILATPTSTNSTTFTVVRLGVD